MLGLAGIAVRFADTTIFKDVSAPIASQFKTAAPKAAAAMKKAA